MADLGVGRWVDPVTLRPSTEEAQLDPDRLVRHAVCFGMTGSGKTGLCVSLLEELVSAGIPLLIIDPKGDLANLALAFRAQRAQDFEPWVDPAEAQRAGLSVAEFAAQTAERWREGLVAWGVTPERVAAFVDRAEVTVHTPGSSAGVPVDVLGSLGRAPVGLADDPEALRELVAGTVSGLLGLVGVDADPVQDPEHIVLSSLIARAWRQGEAVSLSSLITGLVDPPFAKVGVFPVDTFFPRKDRLRLAMALNGVVASPSFEPWRQGVPLDPSVLLDAGDKTAVRVFSLAHLDDAQRSFFVTLLLERLVAWARRQPGTGRLRALLYFDEVYGFLPPHPRNPPSKRPVLTLMKQARAVGLGTMLVTQNPVDVDYAAMSNAGTWLIGRLQTRQDRDRVLDGLAGSAGAVDRKQLSSWLERLPPRTFLVHQFDAPEPRLLHSRWAISYLRGPLTRVEIRRLTQARDVADSTVVSGGAPTLGTAQLVPAAEAPATPAVSATTAASAQEAVPSGYSSAPPPSPSGYDYRFLDPAVVFGARLGEFFGEAATPRRADGQIVWEPALIASLYLVFDEGREFVSQREEHRLFFPIGARSLGEPTAPVFAPADFLPGAPERSLFAPLPALVDEKRELDALKKRVIEELYRGETEVMYRHRALKLTSRGGEAAEAFGQRVAAAIQDRIDDKVVKLRDQSRAKTQRLETRRVKLQRSLDGLQADARTKLASEVVNVGETVFGLFFGGRRKSLNTAMSKRQQTQRANERIARAEADIQELNRDVYDLEEALRTEILEIENAAWVLKDDVEQVAVRLERNDLRLDDFGIVWVPVSRAV